MDYSAGTGGGGGGGGGWDTGLKGSFWRGTDGNVYVYGDQGTNNAGAWDDNTVNYWSGLGYAQINDPFATTTSSASTTNTPTYTNTGTTSTNNSLVQQGLNTGIANLEGQLQVLDSSENQQKLRVNDQYGTTFGRMGQDYQTGRQNLQRAENQVQGSKERSLGNLRTWLQSQGMGYANQLGAMGAGNSSATGMINFALGQQGSRERGGILQDAGTQLENIDLQGKQLEVEYNRGVEDLNRWKQDTLNDIGMQFTQTRQQINNTITDARARAAAEMELTQEAVSYLQQLEQQYRDNANALVQKYQAMTPSQQINQGLLNFSSTPVRQAQLNGFNMPTPVNPESGLTALLRRRDDEQLANPLGVL